MRNKNDLRDPFISRPRNDRRQESVEAPLHRPGAGHVGLQGRRNRGGFPQKDLHAPSPVFFLRVDIDIDFEAKKRQVEAGAVIPQASAQVRVVFFATVHGVK